MVVSRLRDSGMWRRVVWQIGKREKKKNLYHGEGESRFISNNETQTPKYTQRRHSPAPHVTDSCRHIKLHRHSVTADTLGKYGRVGKTAVNLETVKITLQTQPRKRSKHSSIVGIATRYGLNGPGIESRYRWDFPHPSRPALRPTQPPIQRVQDLSRG